MGGGAPDNMKEALVKLDDEWKAAGREGKPKNMALMYFALGDDAERVAKEKLGDYYSFLGDYADQIVQSAAKDADTIKGYVSAFEEAGADELIMFPANSDPAQVELLAGAVGL
jgi:hypothetical protein